MKKRDAIVLMALCGFVLLCAGSGRMRARTQMCEMNLRQLGAGIVTYADTFDGRLPQMEYMAGTPNQTQQHPFWAFRDRSSTDQARWGMAVDFGSLYKAGIVTNPTTFYCPADSRWVDSMKAYGSAGQWGQKIPTMPVNDPYWGGASSTVCLQLNIAYWPQSKILITTAARLSQINRLNLYEVGFPDIAYKMADLDPARAFASDDGRHTISTGPRQADGKAQSALFGDGHVSFGPPPRDPVSGVIYRIRVGSESVGTVDGVSNVTCRYFYYLQP